MFNCEMCGETTRPGTKVHRIPEGYREVDYPFRKKAFLTSVSWKKKPVLRDDPGGDGYELRGVQRVCPTCYNAWVETEATDKVPEGVALPDAASDVVPVPTSL